MKSPMLLSLILSLSVACSSTPDENSSDNLSSEGEIPASVAARPEVDAKESEAKAEAKEAESVSPAAVPAPVETAVTSTEKLVYPTSSLLNVRQGPGKNHSVVRLAKFGEGLAVTGIMENTWLKTTDGLWVSSLFTSESKPAQANDPVPQSAPVGTAVEATPAPMSEEESIAPAAQDAAVPAAPSAP